MIFLSCVSITLILIVSCAIGQEISGDTNATRPARHYLIEGTYYLLDQQDPGRAIPLFRKALTLDPTMAEAYYFLGTAHYQQGKALPVALFYLQEAEKRGIRHDALHADLLAQIKKQYPDLEPLDPRDTPDHERVQVIVGDDRQHAGRVVVESQAHQAQTMSYRTGETISLSGGKDYTFRYVAQPLDDLWKRAILLASFAAVWLLR